MSVQRRHRSRRATLSVPGSNPAMIVKSRLLDVDHVMLDLEDSVAAGAKEQARANVIEALHSGSWRASTLSVRVNGWSTAWTHEDVIDVIGQAGQFVHTIVLPKCSTVHHVTALGFLLDQVERRFGLPPQELGIEVQIEDAAGLAHVREIASGQHRVEALILGPADMMASLRMQGMVVGEQPPGYSADAFHHIFMEILVAARLAGIQAIDGPYLRVRDNEALAQVTARAAALGFDGKWAVHPGQIETVQQLFSPSQGDLDRAHELLAAYAWHTSADGGHRGAVMVGDEMADEASRAMATAIIARGEAAGMRPTSQVPHS